MWAERVHPRGSMPCRIEQLNGLGMESNAYLILCEKPVLIDVGTGARLKETEKRLAAFLDGRKLETLVLTHMHFDHTDRKSVV